MGEISIAGVEAHEKCYFLTGVYLEQKHKFDKYVLENTLHSLEQVIGRFLLEVYQTQCLNIQPMKHQWCHRMETQPLI